MTVATAAPSAIVAEGWWSLDRRSTIVAVYVALAILLAIPMLVATVPLGADTLEHLARIHVRAHIGTDPDLARLFEIRADIIPYLGMDLLLTPLARIWPTLVVGRLYIVALAWGVVGAVIVLQRAFIGRVGLAPAISGLVAYNGLIAWGLVNYVLGLILALLVFAAWHRLRERPWFARLLVFTVAATGLYFCHLLAFALYGLMVGSYELFGRSRPWRTPPVDWLVLAGQAIPAVAWTVLMVRVKSSDTSLSYLPEGFTSVAFLAVLCLNKLTVLETPFLFRGAVGLPDAASRLAILVEFAACLALWRGWLRCPRTLAAPALFLLGLTVAVPGWVFGVALVDRRFPLAAACLVLAGLRLAGPARRWTLPVAVVTTLLTVAHVADVSFLMHGCDGQYAELRGALTVLPRGAELTTVREMTETAPGAACTRLPIYTHMAQLVTIDRSGYASDFFALVTSVAVRDGRPSDSGNIDAEAFKVAPPASYVLWIHFGHRRPGPPGLVLLHRGSFFDLWAPG